MLRLVLPLVLAVKALVVAGRGNRSSRAARNAVRRQMSSKGLDHSGRGVGDHKQDGESEASGVARTASHAPHAPHMATLARRTRLEPPPNIAAPQAERRWRGQPATTPRLPACPSRPRGPRRALPWRSRLPWSGTRIPGGPVRLPICALVLKHGGSGRGEALE